MKALSLWRPWGWTFSDLTEPKAKRLENRTWKLPLKLGETILFHSSQKYDAEAAKRIEEICGIAPPDDEHCPTGLIAFATYFGRTTSAPNGPQGRWFFGPYGHFFGDIVALKPFALPGAQGLWSVPDEVLMQLHPRDEAQAERVAQRILRRPISQLQLGESRGW